MSLTSTVPGERGCNHHVLAWEENDLQTLTCRPGLVPEPPGTAWVDEECQCRFFTGGDNFFFSDEMPGGPHCSIVRVFRMASSMHRMARSVHRMASRVARRSWLAGTTRRRIAVPGC